MWADRRLPETQFDSVVRQARLHGPTPNPNPYPYPSPNPGPNPDPDPDPNQRADDTEESLTKRLEGYHAQTVPTPNPNANPSPSPSPSPSPNPHPYLRRISGEPRRLPPLQTGCRVSPSRFSCR